MSQYKKVTPLEEKASLEIERIKQRNEERMQRVNGFLKIETNRRES